MDLARADRAGGRSLAAVAPASGSSRSRWTLAYGRAGYRPGILTSGLAMKRIALMPVFLPLISLPLILVCLAGAASAQLQPDQKMTDFETLVALFNKQYAPYNWKKEVIGFDMLNLKPWLAKVSATTD